MKILKLELMVEVTQSLFSANGRAHLPVLLNAAEGRCVAAHFGTYDYTASCSVFIEESLSPIGDFYVSHSWADVSCCWTIKEDLNCCHDCCCHDVTVIGIDPLFLSHCFSNSTILFPICVPSAPKPALTVMLISQFLNLYLPVLLQEELKHLHLQLLTMRVLQHISKLKKVQTVVQVIQQ